MNFDAIYGTDEHSKIFDLHRTELEKFRIGYTNGILNLSEDARKNAEYLSSLLGSINVHVVYNGSSGPKLDFVEYVMNLSFVATEPVSLLQKKWTHYFENSSPDSMFIEVCHSQGAVQIRNALLTMPEKWRQRIAVIAVAPGAYILPDSCRNAVHLRNKSIFRDFVPRIDREGMKRAEDTIIDLTSHQDAKWFDHSFTSPTYREAIRNAIEKIIKKNTHEK